MNQIDLNGVFDGVKPQEDNLLPRLVTMIQVEEPVQEEDIPSRLLVTVNGDEIIRYQNLAHLPVEVRDVISTLPGSTGFSKRILLEKIEKLKIAVENMKPSDPPRFLEGDLVRIVEDPMGILVNKDLIGKVGVVKEIVSLGTLYQYLVGFDLEGRDRDRFLPLLGEMLEKVEK